MTDQRIKDLREKKNMTQRELADQVGTSDRQLSRYETGKVKPKAEMLQKLAGVLDTTVEYLLGSTELIGERPHLTALSDEEYRLVMLSREGKFTDLMRIAAAAIDKQNNE